MDISSINFCNCLEAICAGFICGNSGSLAGPSDKSASAYFSSRPPNHLEPNELNVEPGAKSFPSPGYPKSEDSSVIG